MSVDPMAWALPMDDSKADLLADSLAAAWAETTASVTAVLLDVTSAEMSVAEMVGTMASRSADY